MIVIYAGGPYGRTAVFLAGILSFQAGVTINEIGVPSLLSLSPRS